MLKIFSPALPALVVWVVHAVGVGLARGPGRLPRAGARVTPVQLELVLPEPRGPLGSDLVVIRVLLRGSIGSRWGLVLPLLRVLLVADRSSFESRRTSFVVN